MKTAIAATFAALFLAAAAASPAAAQAVSGGYGGFTALPAAGEQPVAGREYRVIMDLTQGGPDDKPLKVLERVARLVNILDAGGVDQQHRKIVVVMHGGSTLSTLTDAAWAARGKGDVNPNSELIRNLAAAGVQLRLCGQSMVANGLTPADLNPAVQVDVAALMTVIHHQQQGYALVIN